MKKVSITDIAKELDISITTVSFVINGKSEERGISPATVKKVKDLIRKWGFKPSSAAQLLRTGRSKTIGLIVEDIGNYFFGNIAKIIEIEAHKNDYNVFFSSTENDNDTAKELIHKMKNGSVDGLIITATNGLKPEIEKLKKENIPFVLIDRLIPGIETNYVILDNYRGAYDLTAHLLANGYTKPGFITIKDGMSQMADRKKGFTESLTKHKLPASAKSVLEVSFKENDEAIIAAIKKFVSGNQRFDSLFFATNYLGVLGIEALQRCGLTIPADIAVVCFDDNDLFRLLNPSITVAAQPITEIATQSIDLLLRLIKKELKPNKYTGKIIQPGIIIRNSSAGKKVKTGRRIMETMPA